MKRNLNRISQGPTRVGCSLARSVTKPATYTAASIVIAIRARESDRRRCTNARPARSASIGMTNNARVRAAKATSGRARDSRRCAMEPGSGPLCLAYCPASLTRHTNDDSLERAATSVVVTANPHVAVRSPRVACVIVVAVGTEAQAKANQRRAEARKAVTAKAGLKATPNKATPCKGVRRSRNANTTSGEATSMTVFCRQGIYWN